MIDGESICCFLLYCFIALVVIVVLTGLGGCIERSISTKPLVEEGLYIMTNGEEGESMSGIKGIPFEVHKQEYLKKLRHIQKKHGWEK